MGLYGELISENNIENIINEFDNVILEFDLSATVEKIKEKIKQALIKLIDTLQKIVNKCSNPRIKMMFNSILGKAKKALTKSNRIKTKEEAEELSKETEELKKKSQEASNIIKFKRKIKIEEVETATGPMIKHILLDLGLNKEYEGLVCPADEKMIAAAGFEAPEDLDRKHTLMIFTYDEYYIAKDMKLLKYNNISDQLYDIIGKDRTLHVKE